MKRLLIIISALFLVSCIEPTVITKYKYVELQKPSLPLPLNLHQPYFHVVSPANKKEFEAKILKENNGVYFAITPGDYELMSENVQEFRRYIKESKAIIDYYENFLSAESPKPE